MVCLGGATPEVLERALDRRKVSSRTRYGYVSTLHGFYQWAVLEGHLSNDPTLRMVRPKLRQGLPRPVTTTDLDWALGQAQGRMRAWLALAAYGGLRCQEIAYLEREDVLDTSDPPLLRIVHGKGRKERVVPLNPDLLMALRALPMPRTGRLWNLTPATVSAHVAKFLDDHGVDATCHNFRHWFGTNVYRSTRDLRLVQELLGHSSPTTTALYTKVSPLDAVPAVQALSSRPSLAALTGGTP